MKIISFILCSATKIKFETGSSSITMSNDGNIVIKGLNVTIEGTNTNVIGTSVATLGKMALILMLKMLILVLK